MKYLSTAAATAMVAAAVLLPRGPAQAAEGPDTVAPVGGVVGVTNPASGTLELRLYAFDEDAGLASAEALLGGQPVSFVPLAGNSVSAVPLPVNTGVVADGPQQLVVEVTDVAGNTAQVLDREITVNNAVAPTGPRASVTVGVSGGEPAGEEPGGGKGHTSSSGGGPGGCRRPQLKMRLARRPLWYTRPKHVPVLRYGRHYPYKGKLTCLSASGKRIPAATGTQVKVYYRVWHRSFKRHHGPVKYYLLRKIKVRKKGQIKVSLGFRSGRTILFRYNGPSGELAKAKLRLAVPPRSRKPPWGPR